MRIALVAPLVSPVLEAQAYGAHAVLIDLARGLASRGHDVTVHAREGSHVQGLRIVTVDPGPVGPRAGATGPWHPPLPGMRRAFAEVFARIRQDGTVVSQHAFDPDPVELGAGLRVLHTLHLPPIAPPVIEALRRVRPAAVTVSEAAGRAWRAAGVEVGIVPNGVPDLDVGRPAVEPVALVAGRISPEKGAAVAIRVARAAGLRPLVVGDVDDATYFASEVRPLLGPEELRPAIDRAELRRLMARCAVLLMPVEWDEPFGLAAAEAQLAGCPVAGYRRGALPEVVAEGVGGILVAPGDEAALVGATRAATGLDRERVRSSARARFSLDLMVERYEQRLATLGARSSLARASGPSHA